MRILRYLQHGLTGPGPHLVGTDCVPETPALRQWADTLPGAVWGAAVDRSGAQRFPPQTTRGRASIATRVRLAVELLKHALSCADAQRCSRLRTEVAVM